MACIFICDLCKKQRQSRMDKNLGLAPPLGWTHTRHNGKKVTACQECLRAKGIDPLRISKR